MSKMTDKDKFKALLDELGVTYEEEDNSLMLYAGVNDHVVGYDGFVTDVSFTEDGTFRWIGVWE